METDGGSEFKIPVISTNELEARSVAYNSQEDGTENETSLPALTNELIEAQYSQCAKIAESQKKLSVLKVKGNGYTINFRAFCTWKAAVNFMHRL